MADTYWDDSWGERLPFLEIVKEDKSEENKKKGSLSSEDIEKLLYAVHNVLSDEE